MIKLGPPNENRSCQNSTILINIRKKNINQKNARETTKTNNTQNSNLIILPRRNIPQNNNINTNNIENKNIKIVSKYQNNIYNVNHGFMLANSFYKDGIPTVNPTGWWSSEKYDGVRAIWNGSEFYTRNLTKIHAPEWFIKGMPVNVSLDGEFFIKRNFFNETSGYIRKLVPDDLEWKDIKFMVFDVPHLGTLPFEDRLSYLVQVAQRMDYRKLYPVMQVKIESLDHLLKIHKDFISHGAEGTILRKPYSPYIAQRTDYLLKLKDEGEEEAYVVGWQQGSGKNTGKLGALEVCWSNPEKLYHKYNLQMLPICQFKVGSGFKDHERCPILEASQHYPVRTMIKVGFNGLQNSGKPRHPTFKGIRWDL